MGAMKLLVNVDVDMPKVDGRDRSSLGNAIRPIRLNHVTGNFVCVRDRRWSESDDTDHAI